MAAKNPKKWFPGRIATISRKPLDKWARELAARHPKFHPYFDTWAEAHGWLLSRAIKDLAEAARRQESVRKHLEKVLAMRAPALEGEAADVA